MPESTSDRRLHLPDLSIAGFRGIEHLFIPRFGRVTLLAGRNGVGKTTVLDAIRIYAGRGRPRMLAEMLRTRGEFTTVFDEDEDEVSYPDVAALFRGRDTTNGTSISIGPENEVERITMHISLDLDDSEPPIYYSGISMAEPIGTLKITFQNKEYSFPWDIILDTRLFGYTRTRRMRHRLVDENEWPTVIQCRSLGPGLLDSTDMVRMWDRISLRDEESLPIRALQLVTGNVVDRVAVIGDEGSRTRGARRRVFIRLQGNTNPVPLKSLGDGAIRLFGVSLALANSRKGFLLIDEAENGIHYSVQHEFWRMILKIAHEENVQVVATTHSWDCIKGFAQAAVACGEAEGVLIRLERDDEGLRAIEYSEDELRVAAEQGIEVR